MNFNSHLLSTYCVLGIVLGAEITQILSPALKKLIDKGTKMTTPGRASLELK